MPYHSTFFLSDLSRKALCGENSRILATKKLVGWFGGWKQPAPLAAAGQQTNGVPHGNTKLPLIIEK